MAPIKTLFGTAIIFLTVFGFNLNANDANKELLRAAAEGELTTVRELIEWGGADINFAGGALGMTALHYALKNDRSKSGACSVAKYLISKMARTNIKGGYPGETAQDLIDKGYCKGQL